MIKVCRTILEKESALKRSQFGYAEINDRVKAVVRDVRLRGDDALVEYTAKFDGVELTPETFIVTDSEIDAAIKKVPKSLITALENAKNNINDYQSRIMQGILTCAEKSFDKNSGVGYTIRPVNRAGIYVPGGKASYPSSVLMCALTARQAGVKEVIMFTPAKNGIHPLTLAAAKICGVDKVFKIGGAQAVAAMAYSTKSVPKCDVIAGPGNIYVTLAKKEVYGEVGIDMIAGPSEILIIADETANPEYIAADMLSQAEHDELASSFLITVGTDISDAVIKELKKQIKKLPKQEIAQKALADNSAILVAKDLTEAFSLSNKIAPEHLELCIKDAEMHLKSIINAGAVFIGNHTPEPVGDYYAGSNHVLPTSGAARHASGLSVENFIKKISIINYSRQMLQNAKDDIVALAEAEELKAHANAVRVRFSK